MGGPVGVVIGGLLGAIIGNGLENVKPVQSRIRELRERGILLQIHVDRRRLKQPQP